MLGLNTSSLDDARQSLGRDGYDEMAQILWQASVREIYKAPRSWTERAYPNLIYFNELDRGNHFAAWQEPALFSAELCAAFRSLR